MDGDYRGQSVHPAARDNRSFITASCPIWLLPYIQYALPGRGDQYAGVLLEVCNSKAG